MKITKKQLEKLVENIIKEQEESFQMKAHDEENAIKGIERLREKYGALMSKMGSKQMNALLKYFSEVSKSLALGGSANHVPQEEHFLKFFAYLHGGPKP